MKSIVSFCIILVREIRDFLNDIFNECIYLINRTQNLNYEKFAENEDLKKAFTRSLEVIGEAAKHIPQNIRKKYPQIPWKAIAGMRNKVIHEYFGVIYERIWKTVKEDIPELKVQVEKMIKDLYESGK